ncbi:uncharacterized protein LOC119689955 [Teleopsis dalmanni]|uniref:uncharacterized protein LOC119689955 n=1 Tax=Teleopsis dalmanni TaxID=139649 RepID=UPI0018CEF6A1|nr:uncharacterized protein LOC119689955 [Teleopsis dalmanni]
MAKVALMKGISIKACKDEVVNAILAGTERGYIQRINQNKYKVAMKQSMMNLLSEATPKQRVLKKGLSLGALMSQRRKSPVKSRPKKSKVVAESQKELGVKGAKRKSLVKNSPRKRQQSGRKKALSKNLKISKKKKKIMPKRRNT